MKKNFKNKLFRIIFEADTKAGKTFDIVLLIVIVISVVVVMLDSVTYFHNKYGNIFWNIEWGITFMFAIEYILRIYSVKKPWKYIFSFYGIIDLLSILPKFLSLIFTGSTTLVVIRLFRLMRIFRVLKLARYVSASETLKEVINNSRRKILVFLEVVMIIVVIAGSLMYLIEGEESGFVSIPRSIYWAIVTVTTVGYGDIAPQTVLGQTLASILMIVGFAIIAVPTSIVGSEMIKTKSRNNTQVCSNCHKSNHEDDAIYCSKCGEKL